MEEFIDTINNKGIIKLFNAVSKGIGTIVAPIIIKRNADAENYKIKKLTDARCYEIDAFLNIMKKNPEIFIKYNNNNITIDNKEFQEVTCRALNRFSYQELIKQVNIEKIVAYAYNELKNEEQISDEHVNDDWVLRFFNSIENISNEELQKIWGRILAGEIKKPNSYSYRALTLLRDMTQTEINIFKKIAKIAVKVDDYIIISSDEQILNEYGIYYSDLIILNEIGVLSIHKSDYYSSATLTDSKFFYNDKFSSTISSNSDKSIHFHYTVYLFTQSGKELIKALPLVKDSDYIIKFLNKLSENYKNINFTVFDNNERREQFWKKEEHL